MQTYSHVCSCGESYTDNDPDVYFCSKCIEQRKAIARQVDAEMKGRVSKKPLSTFGIAMEKGKTIQSRTGGLATFVRAGDLGINLGQ